MFFCLHYTGSKTYGRRFEDVADSVESIEVLRGAALEVENLVKQYDDFTAVDDLYFEVYEGEIFGLLGPNGSGKTTTIRTVMDIFKPDAGAVRVLGGSPGESREKVGYLPEERGLYDNLKVMEVLIYLARLKGVDGKAAKQRAEGWLERFELGDRSGDKVNSLSGGLRQKLQLIVSLVHDPELLRASASRLATLRTWRCSIRLNRHSVTD